MLGNISLGLLKLIKGIYEYINIKILVLSEIVVRFGQLLLFSLALLT